MIGAIIFAALAFIAVINIGLGLFQWNKKVGATYWLPPFSVILFVMFFFCLIIQAVKEGYKIYKEI